jgi:hypothetical protein
MKKTSLEIAETLFTLMKRVLYFEAGVKLSAALIPLESRSERIPRSFLGVSERLG